MISLPSPPRAALSALCCLSLLALAGCGGTAAPPKAKTMKTAVAATQIDLGSVNELLAPSTALQTGILYFALFVPLIEEQDDYADGPPSFRQRLAESWTFSPDRKTLTFKLRPGLVWSDGAPITAEDVAFTFAAQTSPEIGWNNGADKANIEKVEVVDPLTAVFHFKKTYATQLMDANQGVILPKHAWGKLPFAQWRENAKFFQDNLVVSGPFTLEKWEPQQRFVLKRNERYFEADKPKLDRIVFEVMPDLPAQINQLRAGNIDFIEFVPYENLVSLKAEPNVTLLSHVARYYFYIVWNTTRPFLSEKGVRQALTMAIDRQSIVDSLFYGYAKVGKSPYPSNVWAHDQTLEPWPYDPQRAREQLAALGFKDTDGDGIVERDGKKLSIELMTNSENELRKNIMLIAQQQLKNVGIEATTKAIEFNAMLEPLQTRQFDGVVTGLAISTDLTLRHTFHSEGRDSFNWGGYSNPEVDRLIEEVDGTMDPKVAKSLYDRLQALIHDEQPVTFTYESLRVSATSKRLKNADPNAVSVYFHLREWDIEDGD
jgi:peptide/nickel transport system substrate-binding protein